MSEMSETLSELVRESDRYKAALEHAYQEMSNRDTIILSMAMKQMGKKRTLTLDGLDKVDGKMFSFVAAKDNKSGKLTIKNKPKQETVPTLPDSES